LGTRQLGPALLGVVTSPEWERRQRSQDWRLVPLLASWHLLAADVVALLGIRTARAVQLFLSFIAIGSAHGCPKSTTSRLLRVKPV
jgi:hypothetical protein